MARPIDLGRGFSWALAGDATDAVKHVLNNKSKIGEKITGEDAELLMALLENHPDYELITTKGFDHFTIKHNSNKAAGWVLTRGFHVVHPDRTSTSFSYPSCLKPRTYRSRLYEAGRNMISLSQLDFRIEHGNRCVKCGAQRSLHTHHKDFTFKQTLDNWHYLHFGSITDNEGAVEFISVGEPTPALVFKVRPEQDFLKFHDDFATREVLCLQCHSDEHRLMEMLS